MTSKKKIITTFAPTPQDIKTKMLSQLIINAHFNAYTNEYQGSSYSNNNQKLNMDSQSNPSSFSSFSSFMSSSPQPLDTLPSSSLSSAHGLPSTMLSIEPSPSLYNNNCPTGLRRSSSASSRYFKWVRPIARPGRHDSLDEDNNNGDSGTDDSFLEVECPTDASDYIFSYESSLFDQQTQQIHSQSQQEKVRSPKNEYFKWAQRGRRHNEESEEHYEADMDSCIDEDDDVMFGMDYSEDGYNSSDDFLFVHEPWVTTGNYSNNNYILNPNNGTARL